MVVGGGSGGHITPTLAVAEEIRKLNPRVQLIYVVGRKDALSDVIHEKGLFSSVHHVFSGKFRRYHGEGLKQLLDIPTVVKNIRDMVFVAIGCIQAWFLLGKVRPDVIFIKGGFVGVPIGLAAALRRIPFVTHDSDALPGLANRIIGRWAALHTVAMPKEIYSYPQGKTLQVGVPVAKEYQRVTSQMQSRYKESFGLPPEAEVLLITGGGLGAHRINVAMTSIASQLLHRFPELVIVHIAGRGKDEEIAELYYQNVSPVMLDRVLLEPFVTDLERYSGAADLVVARAGASTLAELAAQAKACIIVPNSQLTGGHQVKNTDFLQQKGAIQVVTDAAVARNHELLLQQIDVLLSDVNQRRILSDALHETFVPNAAEKLAKIIVKIGQGSAPL